MEDTQRFDGVATVRGPADLIVRVDANAQIGSGHLMRCLAISQAWKDRGGRVQFVTACTNERLLGLLQKEAFTVHRLERPHPDPADWHFTRCLLAEAPSAWLLVDGYHLTCNYQRQAKEVGHHLIAIDDLGRQPHYYADIVLNQNLHATEIRYSAEPYTRLLLSTKYVLLRREFLAWCGWKRNIPDVARNVLVTLGGSDPTNVTLKVVEALRILKKNVFTIVIVVGQDNPHYDQLQSAVRMLPLPLYLVRNVSDMPFLMAWADLAVCAGGSGVWELCYMGVPMVGLSRAEQERKLLETCAKEGLAVNLGWHETVSPKDISGTLLALAQNKPQRVKMATAGRMRVDGLGCHRVIRAMQEGRLTNGMAKQQSAGHGGLRRHR